ncbi:hypothetical protein CPB84DRAFT_1008882 [Gymnopilus junonius]|uniref:Uncharacterized protein n=1 Tax=Gymnopilus junonius TaxID=109634 RepID=A0A9P5TNZ3_GYMJU|nr:hypothetical protein CPB84DRAFT_1008882 [Gymnopilus junonius]
MSAGCFSWCPVPRRPKKPSTRSIDKLRQNLLVAPQITDSPVDDRSIKATSVKKSSSNGSGAAPTTVQYATATGKEILTILESAAGIIPVPLLQEAIGVALKIIQEGSAVEQKVKDLQERVGHLMIVVVENVTKTEEDSKEVNVKVAKNIENDIQGLLGTLGTIKHDLTEISEQNRWVIASTKNSMRVHSKLA